MSQKSATSADLTGLGQMVLHDDWKPPLQADRYRFVVQQTVELSEGEQQHYYHDRTFIVKGPRFCLPESDYLASFPPAGATGDYARFLPHMVLTKRALPWERATWTGKDNSMIPWLALLVLDQQQLERAGGKQAFGECHPAELKIGDPDDLPEAGRELEHDGKTVLLPVLEDDGDKDDAQTRARYVDLPYDTFKSICPRPADLKRLAHLRQVDMADKPHLDVIEPGFFSVLLANRFPQAGANTVLMVSLDGWESLINLWLGAGDNARELSEAAKNKIADLDDKKKAPDLLVRLILFKNWGFVCDERGTHTFGELAKGLDAASLGMPEPAEASPELRKIFQCGYAPVTYQPAGSTAFAAWYRGPLSPLPSRQVGEGVELFHSADSALVVDEALGMADVSYACAWQLGRLLALASPLLTDGQRSFLDRSADAFQVLQGLEQFLVDHRDELPASSPPADDAAAGDPLPARLVLADDLVAWLGRLLMLYPLPFHYLAADERLIPEESLRFFHLDKLWLEALLDGVLCANLHCAAELEHTGAYRVTLRRQASELVVQYRRRLKGLPPTTASGGSFWQTPVTGFLLRSALVSGWPGMEVEVYDAEEESDRSKMEILRLDHLGSGLLLCLVSGQLHHVKLKEPREGIRFGIDDDQAIVLRSWNGAEIGQNLELPSSYTVLSGPPRKGEKPPEKTTQRGAGEAKLYGIKPSAHEVIGSAGTTPAPHGLLRRQAASGVLDVAALYDALDSILGAGTGGGTFGTGAFALQALAAPETVDVTWKRTSPGGR